MNTDLLRHIFHILSAAPTYPSHDQLNVTVYENGFAISSLLTTPVLSDSGLSSAYIRPSLFVAIRSVLVHAALRWPSEISAYQIADSLQDALFMLEEYQVVFCRSELALLVSAQDITSCCRLHNDIIPWSYLMALDAKTPIAQPMNLTVYPLEHFLNLEEFQMHDAATYESITQPDDLANDRPLYNDWMYPVNYESSSNAPEHHQFPTYYPSAHSLPSGVYSVEYNTFDTIYFGISDTFGESSIASFPERPGTVAIDSHEDTSDSPSPSSTRSSPFPETPASDNFHPEPPCIASPMSTVHNVARQEEQNTAKVTQIVYTAYPTSPTSVAPPSPLSECESLPSSRSPSSTPSSQSSECSSASSASNEENPQAPVKVAGRKVRRTKAGGIKKKKTKSKEKHFCCYCNESFTRDHDAERHQRTCRSNPNCSQKEQCKVCTKPLPVRLDAKRRHWGTLECSDAARKRGYTRVDEDIYELL